MLKREQLENKLRELGYTYKTETKRTRIFRRGTLRAFIPRRRMVSEMAAWSILRQCGADEDEIAEFIRSARS